LGSLSKSEIISHTLSMDDLIFIETSILVTLNLKNNEILVLIFRN